MSNFAYEHVPEYEYVKQVFLDKGFPEKVIQYVLLRNANYHHENLEIRMTVLEKQMVELKDGIEKLDTNIDSVRNELKSELSSKIDSAIKPLYWIFGFVSTFAVSAVIGLFIHYLSNK